MRHRLSRMALHWRPAAPEGVGHPGPALSSWPFRSCAPAATSRTGCCRTAAGPSRPWCRWSRPRISSGCRLGGWRSWPSSSASSSCPNPRSANWQMDCGLPAHCHADDSAQVEPPTHRKASTSIARTGEPFGKTLFQASDSAACRQISSVAFNSGTARQTFGRPSL
jgi:hypothetical protein